MSEADLKVAVEEYFNKRGLNGKMKVHLRASPHYDQLDRASGTYDISATAELEVTGDQFKI